MKKNRTKTTMIWATAAMLLTLTACGGQAAGEPAADTQTQAAQAEALESAEASRPTEAVLTETETQEAAQENEQTLSGSVDGMVIAAAMNSLTLMSPEGEVLLFSYPEDGVKSDLEDGVLLGEVINVTYSGSQDAGDAVAEAVKAGTTELALDREAYEFAIMAVEAAKFGDLETLAQMTAYPVYVGIDGSTSVTVQEKADFVKLDREALLPLGELADYNLFDLQETQAGIVIGDGKPNITFSAAENGYAITGINVQ